MDGEALMALRKVGSRGIDLPWERRRGLVRRLRLTRARPFVAIVVVAGLAVLLGTRERQRTGERSTLHPSWKDPTRGIDWTNHTDVLRVMDEGWSERLGHPLPPLPEPLRPR